MFRAVPSATRGSLRRNGSRSHKQLEPVWRMCSVIECASTHSQQMQGNLLVGYVFFCLKIYFLWFLLSGGKAQCELLGLAKLATSSNLPSSKYRQWFTILAPCSSQPSAFHSHHSSHVGGMGPNQSPGVSMPTQTRHSYQIWGPCLIKVPPFTLVLPPPQAIGMAPKVGPKDDGGHCASHQHTMAWAERALKHSHCPKSLLSTPKRKWKRTSYNNRTKPPSTTFAFPHLSAIHRACQVQSCQETKENIGLVVVLPRTYLVVLPGPALPGNKGKHWVGG